MTQNSGLTTFTGLTAYTGLTPYTGLSGLRGVTAYAASAPGTAPTITSDGGGSTAAVSVASPDQDVTTVTATGTAVVSFSLSGGADVALFEIDAATGDLSFLDPSEAGTYVVIVQAVNLWGSDTQAITVTVTGGAGWLLSGGIWNDAGVWDDAAVWED